MIETGIWVKNWRPKVIHKNVLNCITIFSLCPGAEVFISLEKPNEEKAYEDKRERAREVQEATKYLSNAFWWYIKDTDTYNFTYEE